MAFSEFEQKRLTKVISGFIEKHRPPAHLREQLDLTFSIEGQSVVLLEKRRLMDGKMIECPFAKATWVKTQEVWKLYWQRADLKWHSYQPVPSVSSIETVCRAIDEDAFGCFWG